MDGIVLTLGQKSRHSNWFSR